MEEGVEELFKRGRSKNRKSSVSLTLPSAREGGTHDGLGLVRVRDALDLLLVELDVHAGGELLEMLDGGRADDGCRHIRLRHVPCQGDLCH